MKRAPSALGLLIAGCAAIFPDIAAHGVTLTSNLAQPIDGVERINRTRWLGSQFKTDGQAYLLDMVTERLQRNLGGSLEAAIFTDANGQPGTLIAVLGKPSAISGAPGNVVFRSAEGSTADFNTTASELQSGQVLIAPGGVKISGLPTGDFVEVSGVQPTGLALEPNTTYWVVTRASSGEYASAYTDQETGTGPGYSPTWAHSENAGATWKSENLSPLFLAVDADPFQPVFLELRVDYEAIASAIASALPMAQVQREALFEATRDITRDVNARLYRNRARTRSLDREQYPTIASRFEYFTTGEYSTNDQESRFPASGFGSDVFSSTTGAEYHITPEFTLGVAFTYIESDNRLGLGLGNLRISGEAFTTYVSFAKSGFYADALYSLGIFEHEIRRDTLFGRTALATPESITHTVQLNFGYSVEIAEFITGPFTTLTYITGDLDGYTEAAGGTANVRVAGQNFDSLVSQVGWQVSRDFRVRRATITPQFRLSWTHEFLDAAETVGVGLEQSPFAIGSGGRFQRIGRFDASSKTEAPGADALEIGFALGMQLSANFGIVLDYATRMWQGENFGQSLSLTGSFKF